MRADARRAGRWPALHYKDSNGSGSRHRPHARGDPGQQLEGRLPVLFADRVAIGGQSERGQDLVAQIAQSGPLAAIG